MGRTGKSSVDGAGDIANLKSLHLSVTRQVAITIKFYSMLHFMRTKRTKRTKRARGEKRNRTVWQRLSAEIMASETIKTHKAAE